MHGFRRGRPSEYGVRLREKQKAKRIYGVLERQFRKYFAEADRLRGNTGANLLILLERRLDNAVYQLGFADSRSQARQFVAHGHVTVNGKKIDASSHLIKVGDVIAPKTRKKSESIARETLEAMQGRSAPEWLTLEAKELRGTVNRLPAREDVSIPINEAYIVEFSSR